MLVFGEQAILRKQVEAQNTKLAVSAASQYATNAKYVEVNSGKHPRIRVFPGMHALSPDEVGVHEDSHCLLLYHPR
jgi:hypothetical protein